MPWAAAAAVGGALIGADASRSASNKQVDAANRATDLQKQMYDQTRADQAPYRDVGYSALDRLSVLLGLSGNAPGTQQPMQRTEAQLRAALAPRYADNPAGLDAAVKSWQDREAANVAEWKKNGGVDGVAGFGDLTKTFTGADLQNDPGYQFRLQQGTDAIENSRAASGGLFSGAAGKALTEYGQGFASQEFGNAYNRFNNDQSNLFNRLSGLSGTGQTANQQVAQAGKNYANQAGQNMIGAGNAQAANSLAQGNIWGNLLNQGAAGFGRSGMSGGMSMPAPFSGSGTGYGIGGGDGFYTDPYSGI